MTMQGGRIFIDARTTGKYSVTDYKYTIASTGRDGAIELGEKILLVDPWRLLPRPEGCLDDFKEELCRSYPDGEVYQKFKKNL
jgi:hypothetical protein